MLKYLAVAGAPRTGTSAMKNLLSFDDRIYITHEIGSFTTSGPLSAHQINKFVKGPNNRRTNNRKGVDVKELVAEIKRTKANGEKFMQLLAKWGGSDVQVVGDKEPLPYLHAIDRIINQPNTKIIILVRDGRDTVYAYTRPRKTKGSKAWWRADNLVRAQQIWIDAMRVVWDKTGGQNSDKILLARYEEVGADPDKFMNSVQEFMGIEPRIIPNAKYFKPTRSGEWPEKMPHLMDAATLEFIQYLEFFGYEV